MALDDLVRARLIDVSTEAGVVTLSGTVRSATERERAVQWPGNCGGYPRDRPDGRSRERPAGRSSKARPGERSRSIVAVSKKTASQEREPRCSRGAREMGRARTEVWTGGVAERISRARISSSVIRIEGSGTGGSAAGKSSAATGCGKGAGRGAGLEHRPLGRRSRAMPARTVAARARVSCPALQRVLCHPDPRFRKGSDMEYDIHIWTSGRSEKARPRCPSSGRRATGSDNPQTHNEARRCGRFWNSLRCGSSQSRSKRALSAGRRSRHSTNRRAASRRRRSITPHAHLAGPGIYKALQVLYPDQSLADQWVHFPTRIRSSAAARPSR